MARIPTPDRGQPIDVPYLYQLATAVNSLAEQIDASSEKYTTVFSREAQKQDLKTSNTKFFASFVDLPQRIKKNVGDTEPFGFDISGFKYPPIVTATPVNTGTSKASNDVTVIISNVTLSRISGFVRFNTAGEVDIAVNVIAIGVPE